MNKLVLVNKEQDKKIITFTINKEIKAKLKKALQQSEHYNLKMKSEWVNEAIVMLQANPNFKEMVCHAEGHNENFVFDKIYMTFSQRCLFAEVRNAVVAAYPDIKGPQAAVIRAAILSRLMREPITAVDNYVTL